MEASRALETASLWFLSYILLSACSLKPRKWKNSEQQEREVCLLEWLAQERTQKEREIGEIPAVLMTLLAACAFFAHVLHCKQDVFH
jgi:hypothetical protein